MRPGSPPAISGYWVDRALASTNPESGALPERIVGRRRFLKPNCRRPSSPEPDRSIRPIPSRNRDGCRNQAFSAVVSASRLQPKSVLSLTCELRIAYGMSKAWPASGHSGVSSAVFRNSLPGLNAEKVLVLTTPTLGLRCLPARRHYNPNHNALGTETTVTKGGGRCQAGQHELFPDETEESVPNWTGSPFPGEGQAPFM